MSKAIDDTERWLERAVVGLQLCPFARPVHAAGRIRWVECRARRAEALLATLVDELMFLRAADPATVETTLVVHPLVLRDFGRFNAFLGVVEVTLAELKLEGVIQVAAFHPRWRFADHAAGDIANATNRSPHPTLHLLREASVARAVAGLADPAAIYRRNIETLRTLGREGFERLLKD